MRRIAGSNRKRVSYKASLFALVASQCADGGAGARFAAGVRDFATQNRAQPGFDESPCPHVFRFFLAPDELRVLRKWLEHFAQFLFSQRIKLLYANDRSVVDFALGPVIEQIIINFAGAKDDPLYSVGGSHFGRAEDFFETAMDEFFSRRGSKAGTQQTFRGHDDQGLDEIALHLTPQHMKILRGRGQIADLHVVLGAGLEKTLEARAGMFGALTFIAMRKQQHNPTRSLPFGFR